jgi:hypothetical protein
MDPTRLRPDGLRHRLQRQHRWRLLLLAATGVLALSGLLGLGLGLPTTAAPQPRAGLTLQGPSQVQLGQPIELTLSLSQASNVAGYQTTVHFNTTQAHLRGLHQRDNTVRQLGRDVQTLGPIEQPNGVTFGAYSCPFSRCTTVTLPTTKTPQGASGAVQLARFSLVADQSGPLTISLAETSVVDAQGNALPLDLQQTTLTVQVTEGTN